MDPKIFWAKLVGYELTAERADFFAIMHSWKSDVFLDIVIGVDPDLYSQAEGRPTEWKLPWALDAKRSALSVLLRDAVNAGAIKDSSPHSYIEWVDHLEREEFRAPAIVREAVARRHRKVQSQAEQIKAIEAAYETATARARLEAAELVSAAQKAEREAVDRADKLQANKLALEQELARVKDDRPRWPWGEHETELLRNLEAAAKRFWGRDVYDAADKVNTAPKNDPVEKFLSDRGASRTMAKAIATILRADDLRTGRR